MMPTELKATPFKRYSLAKDYYMLGTLGEGSFGQVKVALHLMTNTLVVIKVLQRDTIIDLLTRTEVDLL